jgi:hypothetical protein
MKHLVFTSVALVVLCLCISAPAIAQYQQQTQQTSSPGEEKAQKLAQVLNLSPQQQSQLAPILQAEAPKVKGIMQDPNLSGSEKKSRLKKVHSQTDPLVKSILNPTQYKQWQTIRNDELENMNMK